MLAALIAAIFLFEPLHNLKEKYLLLAKKTSLTRYTSPGRHALPQQQAPIFAQREFIQPLCKAI